MKNFADNTALTLAASLRGDLLRADLLLWWLLLPSGVPQE